MQPVHLMVAVVAICLAVLPIIVVPDDTSSSSEEEINNGKISIRQRRPNRHQQVRRGNGHRRLRNKHKSCRSCSSTHATRGTIFGLPHAPVQNTMKETIIRNTASKSGGVLNQLLSVNRQQMKSSKIYHKSPDDQFPDEDSCEDSPENGKCKRRPKTDGGKGKGVGKPGDGGHVDTDTNGGGHGGKKTEIPRIATDTVPSTLLPCVPGQPVTRPSLPEIPAQFNLLSKKLQRIIGGKTEKNRVGMPCIPVVTTKNPSKGEKSTVNFNDIPSPTTPCLTETIPVTWPCLPEIPAQVKDIYDSVLRAIGAKTGTVDDKVSSRCVPFHSTEQPMTSMADENGVSIGYDVGREDGDDIATNNYGDVATTSLPPCVPEIPVTRPYLPEIPAQIRYFYESILRFSGAKSRRKSDQARCVTNVATSDEPVTNDGRGNEAGGKTDNTATNNNRDEHVGEETTSSPPCIPEVPITQPYLPEIPAQLRKLTDKMLLLIGVESTAKSSCITKTTTPQLHHTAIRDDHQEEVSTVLESSSRLPDDTQVTKTKAPEDSLPELPAQLKKPKYK